jgi:hypothetical protein
VVDFWGLRGVVLHDVVHENIRVQTDHFFPAPWRAMAGFIALMEPGFAGLSNA